MLIVTSQYPIGYFLLHRKDSYSWSQLHTVEEVMEDGGGYVVGNISVDHIRLRMDEIIILYNCYFFSEHDTRVVHYIYLENVILVDCDSFVTKTLEKQWNHVSIKLNEGEIFWFSFEYFLCEIARARSDFYDRNILQ
jgi:hypothetical protein